MLHYDCSAKLRNFRFLKQVCRAGKFSTLPWMARQSAVRRGADPILALCHAKLEPVSRAVGSLERSRISSNHMILSSPRMSSNHTILSSHNSLFISSYEHQARQIVSWQGVSYDYIVPYR